MNYFPLFFLSAKNQYIHFHRNLFFCNFLKNEPYQRILVSGTFISKGVTGCLICLFSFLEIINEKVPN